MSYASTPSPVETGGGGACEAASNSASGSCGLGDDHPASEGGKATAVPTANLAASTHPTKAAASQPPQSNFGLNECQKDVSCINVFLSFLTFVAQIDILLPGPISTKGVSCHVHPLKFTFRCGSISNRCIFLNRALVRQLQLQLLVTLSRQLLLPKYYLPPLTLPSPRRTAGQKVTLSTTTISQDPPLKT